MGFALFYDFPPSVEEREPSPTKHPPATHHPTDQATTTAVQQQWSSTYGPIHNGSTVVTTAVHLWYVASSGLRGGAKLGGICIFLRFSTFRGRARAVPAGKAFHAPRSRSWDSSAVVSAGTPRADAWRGRGTGVRSLGTGWRAVERRVVRKCTDLRVGSIGPLYAQGSHVILVIPIVYIFCKNKDPSQ